MHKIELSEWDNRPKISKNEIGSLSPTDCDLLPRLRQAGIVIDELSDGIRIQTKSFVGRVTLDAFDLVIEPKLKGMPLYESFRYAFDLNQLHTLGKQITTKTSFVEILIAELIGEVRDIQRRGPFQQYQKERKELVDLRGQIDQAAWLRRGGMASETLPCVFYRRSHDNILNWTLCAGLRLGTMLSQSPKVKTTCRMLADTFAESVSEQPLSKRLIVNAFRHLNRLNAHYEQALLLIRLLQEGIGGFTHGTDRCERIPGFLFDMNKLFEKCLERLFRENLPGVKFSPQKEFRLFSFASSCNPKNQSSFGFRPDYTFEYQGETIILDAKYRDLWKKPLPTSMLYQLLVYAMAAAVPHQSVILYPTLHQEAKQQKINLVADADKQHLCSVTLQPVDLQELSKIVSQDTDIDRQRFAEKLVSIHQLGMK